MVRLSDPSAIIEFGRFSILPHRRQLLAEGQPIRLGGRAFDLLLALLDAPGIAVGKDKLLSRIWPGPRSGPRSDPDGFRARLPIHRRDPRTRG